MFFYCIALPQYPPYEALGLCRSSFSPIQSVKFRKGIFLTKIIFVKYFCRQFESYCFPPRKITVENLNESGLHAPIFFIQLCTISQTKAALCNNRSHYAYVFCERVTIILNDVHRISSCLWFYENKASIFFFSGGWDKTVRI